MNEEDQENVVTLYELTIKLAWEPVARDSKDVPHDEYLITRGLPASIRSYSMRRLTTITCTLDTPPDQLTLDYLDYLKKVNIVDAYTIEPFTVGQ